MTITFQAFPVDDPLMPAPRDREIMLWNGRWYPGHWEIQAHHKKPKPYWTSHVYEYAYGVASMRENQPTHWAELSSMLPSPPSPETEPQKWPSEEELRKYFEDYWFGHLDLTHKFEDDDEERRFLSHWERHWLKCYRYLTPFASGVHESESSSPTPTLPTPSSPVAVRALRDAAVKVVNTGFLIQSLNDELKDAVRMLLAAEQNSQSGTTPGAMVDSPRAPSEASPKSDGEALALMVTALERVAHDPVDVDAGAGVHASRRLAIGAVAREALTRLKEMGVKG